MNNRDTTFEEMFEFVGSVVLGIVLLFGIVIVWSYIQFCELIGKDPK